MVPFLVSAPSVGLVGWSRVGGAPLGVLLLRLLVCHLFGPCLHPSPLQVGALLIQGAPLPLPLAVPRVPSVLAAQPIPLAFHGEVHHTPEKKLPKSRNWENEQ